jgi:hypothetical protein
MRTHILWQFINHLINLLARHQLLKIACQLEKKHMLGAYYLLKLIESELQSYLSATEGRVVQFLPILHCAFFSSLVNIFLTFFCCFGTLILVQFFHPPLPTWLCFSHLYIWRKWWSSRRLYKQLCNWNYAPCIFNFV